MNIPRLIKDDIKEKIQYLHKVFIIYGSRQIGKTTLVKEILSELNYNVLSVNADEKKYTDILGSRDLKKLISLVSGYEMLFIDEAQRIPDIGLNLKLLVDNLPDLKIIATGSSSLDLANSISEPLTGRTWTYTLYPIAFEELNQASTSFELTDSLEERLVYGSYPEIFSLKNNEDKRKYLFEITNSYLYKDVLQMSTIKHSNKINDLVKLLSFQIGSEVSLSELASKIEIDKTTVARYIDLLEKSFVIFRLSGLSRKLRKEVNKMDKIYFYDLGIRNTVIDNLKQLKDRNDQGALWENFLIIERMKLLSYTNKHANKYFWRTYTGAEIDYIEESDGILNGYEFKWGNKVPSAPKVWSKEYDNSTFKVINRENYLSFITK